MEQDGLLGPPNAAWDCISKYFSTREADSKGYMETSICKKSHKNSIKEKWGMKTLPSIKTLYTYSK